MKTKKLICRTCDQPIDLDTEENWINGNDIFCSEHCIARWHGDELNNIETDDHKKIIEKYGVEE